MTNLRSDLGCPTRELQALQHIVHEVTDAADRSLGSCVLVHLLQIEFHATCCL